MPDDAAPVGNGAAFPAPAAPTMDTVPQVTPAPQATLAPQATFAPQAMFAPQANAAPRFADDTRSAQSSSAPGTPDFPADTRTLALPAAQFVGGEVSCRLTLLNPAARDASEAAAAAAAAAAALLPDSHHQDTILHVRLSSTVSWLRVTPSEAALGPGEKQTVVVRIAVEKAREAAAAGMSPVVPVQLAFQRLYPGAAPSPTGTGAVYVRLPLAVCPACHSTLPDAEKPEICPACFERLRACPICGAPNSWLASRCALDESHVLRSSPDWPMLGGGPGHTGSRPEGRAAAALSRRWSFPSVPSSVAENILSWSAPVAAYGLVAAAAATHQGDAHLYAFDTTNGAPLWEPYPLPDPVYPERGGAAIAKGRLFAATVEGMCVCVDVLRGTRIWETKLNGRVFGAVIPAGDDGPLLVPAATSGGNGCLYFLDAATGRILRQTPLAALPDAAPTAGEDTVFVHDEGGALTAIDLASGAARWSVNCGSGFDAAPVLSAGKVFSATSAGMLLCHDAHTGAEIWRVTVTSAVLGGTPAHDGTLLYVPADDGVHLVSNAGRAVRRYGLGRPVRGMPVVVGGVLFFGATDGRVYGVDAARSLQTLYETGHRSQIVVSPAFEGGTLFVAATNGVLYALAVS